MYLKPSNRSKNRRSLAPQAAHGELTQLLPDSIGGTQMFEFFGKFGSLQSIALKWALKKDLHRTCKGVNLWTQ